MSEPYTLLFQAPVTAERLRVCLDQPLEPLASYADWDTLDLDLTPSDLDRAQRSLPRTGRGFLAELRQDGRRTLGWYFAIDPASGYLTGASLLWTSEAAPIVAGLGALRQVLARASDGRPGHILVQNVVFGRGTAVAGVLLNGTGSVAAGPDDPALTKAAATALPFLTSLRDAASAAFDAADDPGQPGPDADTVLTDHYASITGAA